MDYENLLEIMFERFPEFKNVYNEDDRECGLYIVFGLSLTPYVIELLSKYKDNEEFLKNLFEFYEDMATSTVEEVKDLLMYSILENLGDDKEILLISRKYMGRETRSLSEAVENFLGRSWDN